MRAALYQGDGNREHCRIGECDKAQRPQFEDAQFAVADGRREERCRMDNPAATGPLPQGQQRSTTRLEIANAEGVDTAFEEYFRGDVLRSVHAPVIDDEPVIYPEPASVV